MTERHDPDRPRPGDGYLVMSDLITFRVTSSESAGRVTVVQIDVPPGGGPPPLHTHPPDEVFHVMTGKITVFRGTPAERTVLDPGRTEHVPGGMPHTFRNLTDRPARLLVTFVPGPMMEEFFVRAGHQVRDPAALPQLDLEAEVARVFAVGRSLGMELLGPAA